MVHYLSNASRLADRFTQVCVTTSHNSTEPLDLTTHNFYRHGVITVSALLNHSFVHFIPSLLAN